MWHRPAYARSGPTKFVRTKQGITGATSDPNPSAPPLFAGSLNCLDAISQLTFPSFGSCSLVGPLGLLHARARSGVRRRSTALPERAVGRGRRRRAGQHQAGEARPAVDGARGHGGGRRPHRDGARPDGGLGADGGRQGGLGLRLESEEPQKRREEDNQCGRLVHMQRNYCQLLPCLISAG